MRILLALRALLFVLVLPGSIVGLLPFEILSDTQHLRLPRFGPSSAGAAFLTVAGAVVLLRCVWDFFASGHGTLAPVDPPRQLVTSGLYRFTRNPMFNGVLAVLLGEAWLFSSVPLVKYTAVAFIAMHLSVLFYEEPALESRFGDSYRAYRSAVPRWGFTVRPFRESTGGTA